MRVGVWGAGSIGTGLIYRLATTWFTSELHWINRSYAKIELRVVDLEQGLGFAPTCCEVDAHRQEDLGRVLPRLDLIILTLGEAVPPGGKREDVYAKNRDLFRSAVLPALRGFPGIVLIVTNPLDLMSRLVFRETGIAERRVLGLGTVVETARLRASLGSYLSPRRPAREVWAYAVGTHDESFVPLTPGDFGMGTLTDDRERKEILKRARREVVRAAARVKGDHRSTLHPIVEGTLQIAEAVAGDRQAILTPSVLDRASEDSLFYSVPCSIGREGVGERHLDALREPGIHADLEVCKQRLRDSLRAAGDL